MYFTLRHTTIQQYDSLDHVLGARWFWFICVHRPLSLLPSKRKQEEEKRRSKKREEDEARKKKIPKKTDK